MNGHRPQGYRTRLTGHLTFLICLVIRLFHPEIVVLRADIGAVCPLSGFEYLEKNCSSFVLWYSEFLSPYKSAEIGSNPAEYLAFPLTPM